MDGCSQAVICLIAFILLFILLPMSFSRVDYYEYGLVQRRSTGTVSRDKVFGPGNHLIGPDYSFITFPNTAQTMEFVDLSVWTKSSDTDAGTAMLLDLSFQYVLKQDSLVDLYELVATNYESLIRNVALNTIKNNATSFSADHWVQSRRMIQDELRNSVGSALKSAHAGCVLLQLRKVQFPPSFVARRLDAAIQVQRNAEEAYKQTATITRSETGALVLEVENEALLVERNAEAQASLIAARAANLAKDYEQRSRSEGLALVTEAVGITEQAEVVSLDYLVRLKDTEGATTYVGFTPSQTRPID